MKIEFTEDNHVNVRFDYSKPTFDVGGANRSRFFVKKLDIGTGLWYPVPVNKNEK